MQLHDMVIVYIYKVACSNLVFYCQFTHKHFVYKRINLAIDEVKYFIRMREREMLKVTKCVGVNSFFRALINMVCELKITSGSKNNCVKISW